MVIESETNGYQNEKPNVNVNANVNDNENVNVKESKSTRKAFVPPTLENVSGYCREMGYSVDAERFINFYESKGWMVGKNKMKDWKAAVRNWAKQDKDAKPSKPPNKFHNFEQRDYDFDELERGLLNGKNKGEDDK